MLKAKTSDFFPLKASLTSIFDKEVCISNLLF